MHVYKRTGSAPTPTHVGAFRETKLRDRANRRTVEHSGLRSLWELPRTASKAPGTYIVIYTAAPSCHSKCLNGSTRSPMRGRTRASVLGIISCNPGKRIFSIVFKPSVFFAFKEVPRRNEVTHLIYSGVTCAPGIIKVEKRRDHIT